MDETPTPPKGVTLSITFNPDGTVSVTGPIQDKAICYSMLEMARDAICEKHMETRIVRPKGGIMNFMRTNGH